MNATPSNPAPGIRNRRPALAWLVAAIAVAAPALAPAQAPDSMANRIMHYQQVAFGVSVIVDASMLLNPDGTFTGIMRRTSIEPEPLPPLNGTYTYSRTGADTGTLSFTLAGSTLAQINDLTFASTAQGSYSFTGGTGSFVLSDFPFATALVNTSQRCWVSDTQPGIIGFVVPPGRTVLVLVRAIGPGLAGFPDTTPAEDPRLEIYRGTTLIAGNDDWGVGSFGPGTASSDNLEAATAALTDFVGAFALAEGSKDAAYLLEIGAGNYTVQVRSAPGEPRAEILGEVYVVP